jgi:hypothetical protein
VTDGYPCNRGGGRPASPFFFPEETMEEHWLWPFRGGTWKERLLALAYALELALAAAAFYWLAWALAPCF